MYYYYRCTVRARNVRFSAPPPHGWPFGPPMATPRPLRRALRDVGSLWAQLTMAGGRQSRSRPRERPRRGRSSRVDTGNSPPSWGASGFPDAGTAARLVPPPQGSIAAHVSCSLTPLCRDVSTRGRRESQTNGAGGRVGQRRRRASSISRGNVS